MNISVRIVLKLYPIVEIHVYRIGNMVSAENHGLISGKISVVAEE